MTDFAAARRMMVDGQVRTSDVTDLRLIAAMLDVPRERFVPQASAALAYLDQDVPIAADGRRRLLKPMVLAKMVQAAGVGESDHVLDVACGTGYSTAILARLAGSVVGLEAGTDLAGIARTALSELGIMNASVVTAPLAEGFSKKAPYDVILVNGAIEVLPEALARQLKEGGRLVTVVGRPPTGRATLYRSTGGVVSGWPIFDAAAPPLPDFAKPPAFVF
jgi:protein-L-isoaspartate(D-aspartate) O-methyltransferase